MLGFRIPDPSCFASIPKLKAECRIPGEFSGGDNLKRIWIALAAIILILLIFGGVFVSYYNSFVTKDQAVESQWAQVETQYQRRFDLIPNLVAATKGIFKQEKEVFGKLAEARTRYAGAGGKNVDEQVKAANQVESALARLLVILENYPNLRSSESVQQLMVQLEGTENRISVERRRYNEKVRDFNTSVKRFPGRLFAGIFGFSERAFFKSESGAGEAPKVEF